MPVTAAAKTRIHISTAPASAAARKDFEALSWVEIGETTSLGAFGSEFQEITHSALSDPVVRKFKGVENPGNLTIELGQDLTDAGQIECERALNSKDDYAFKIVLNDAPAAGKVKTPTHIYLRGKLMAWSRTIGDSNQIISVSGQIGLSARPLVVKAAAS